MNQLTFFDAPLARTRDPATSHVAAEEIGPKLGVLKARMLSVIKCDGPCTAAEAAQECVRLWGGLAESYRKRASWLCDKRIIERCAPRNCRVTKHLATTYRCSTPRGE